MADESVERAQAIADDLLEMRSDSDEWGTVLGLLFDIAEILWLVEGERVHAEFRPSPMLPRGGGREHLEEPHEWLLEEYDTAELQLAFPILMARRDKLEAEGKAY